MFLTRRQVFATAAATTLIRPARATPAGTVSIGLVNYPPNLRPFENSGSSQGAFKLAVFRSLLSYDIKGNLVPELAETWTVESPTVHVLKLRENARFHNGEPVRAEDVKYTYEQIVKPGSTAYLKPEFGIVDRVEIIDPLTVRIVLQQPSAPFGHLLASYHAPILSAKVADVNAPIGAGPYRFVSQERGVAIDVERFPQYYKPGRPKAARIRFIAYGDETLRAAALEAGDVDIIEGVPWQNMDALERNPRVKLDNTDGPFMYLLFNAKTGPFTDARLRRAVGFAIKREEIVKTAMYGRGSVLEALPYPPGTSFSGATEKFWGYDPDRARKLMAEAGFPNGFKAKLLATSSPTLHQATAEVVQANLAEIGISVELSLPEWGTRVAMGNRGQYEFAVMGVVGVWPDPDSLATYLATAPGAYSRPFGFSSAKIDSLLAAGRSELDPARRRVIYDELQHVAAEEAPIVGLAWRTQAYGMQRGVTGFANMPGFLTFYSPILLEETVAA
jgi:peptide/nickel transport system substrate-binding protein